MKVSDYIAKFLANKGIEHTFGITGGCIVHLFDSISKTDGIDFICTNHEQAAAMSAEGYARVSGKTGVCISTSGPGVTNLLTGICCSYYDSIPIIAIAGQVPVSHLKGKDVYLRQRGFQEVDVIDIFSSVTKKAFQVTDATDIRKVLEEAYYIANDGRPGPVIIDLPDDIQRADIDPDKLEGYVPSEYCSIPKVKLHQIDGVVDEINNSDQPLLIFGYGIKAGKCEDIALKLKDKLRIPTLTTWATKDMIKRDDVLNAGVFGTIGSKYGNLAIQNADLIISIGSRLDLHKTGTNVNDFGRNAKKIIIDVRV